MLGDLESPARTRVLASESQAIFAPPDHLVYLREGALVAARFDPVRLEVTGDPVELGLQPWSSGGGLMAASASRHRRARVRDTPGADDRADVGRSQRKAARHAGRSRLVGPCRHLAGREDDRRRAAGAAHRRGRSLDDRSRARCPIPLLTRSLVEPRAGLVLNRSPRGLRLVAQRRQRLVREARRRERRGHRNQPLERPDRANQLDPAGAIASCSTGSPPPQAATSRW